MFEALGTIGRNKSADSLIGDIGIDRSAVSIILLFLPFRPSINLILECDERIDINDDFVLNINWFVDLDSSDGSRCSQIINRSCCVSIEARSLVEYAGNLAYFSTLSWIAEFSGRNRLQIDVYGSTKLPSPDDLVILVDHKMGWGPSRADKKCNVGLVRWMSHASDFLVCLS